MCGARRGVPRRVSAWCAGPIPSQDNYGSGITTTNLGNLMTNPSFGQNTNNWGQRTATVSAKFVF